MTTHKINTHGVLTIKNNPLRDKPQHTPWTLEECANGGMILRRHSKHHPQSHLQIVPKEDAYFILKAVNNHDFLVEALKELVKGHNYKMGKSAMDLRFELAKTALAQVEKG